jgi:hypothetical protein
VTRDTRTTRRRSLPPPRDQHETAFTRILRALVSRIPGARAAALVDLEGETVDYWALIPPFDVKVAAAQWRVVVDEIRDRRYLSATTFVALRGGRASYQAHVLPEGYALVVVLSRGAGFGGWRRAVAACRLELAREASWSTRGARAQTWYATRVTTDGSRRPVALGVPPCTNKLEVLGSMASGMGRRERGWRVRVANGIEATLVREPGGNWYVDEADALPELVARQEPQSR